MAKLRTVIAILEIATSFLVVFSVCGALYLRYRQKRKAAEQARAAK